MSKWVTNIVGALLTLVGIFWLLQGLNVIPIGAMSGQVLWVVIGLVVAIVGVLVLVRANRGRPAA